MTGTAGETTPVILLAGGRAARMGGGDKCLRQLGGHPLLQRVIDILRPQVGAMLLNANGDPARFSRFGLPVVADDLPDHPGPLAGILAGLDWVAANQPEAVFALTVSTDCPFLPGDLAARLAAAWCEGGGREGARREEGWREAADIVLAASGGRVHPVIGLWRVTLRADLRAALTRDGIHKVERFCERHRSRHVDFPFAPGDPFFNVNTEDDLAAAAAMLAAGNDPAPR